METSNLQPWYELVKVEDQWFLYFNFKKMLIHCKLKNEKICGIYIWNRTVFSHKKEWNLAICNSINWPWGHYAKWISHINANTVWSYLYIGSFRRLMLIDTKNRWWLAEVGLGGGQNGWRRSKGTNLHLYINKLWGCNVPHGDYS